MSEDDLIIHIDYWPLAYILEPVPPGILRWLQHLAIRAGQADGVKGSVILTRALANMWAMVDNVAAGSGFLWLLIILRKSEYRQTLLTGLVLGRVRSWAAPPQHSGRGRTCCTGPRCPSRCTPAALSSPPDYINRNVMQAAKVLLYLTSRIPNTNATKWPKTTVICR